MIPVPKRVRAISVQEYEVDLYRQDRDEQEAMLHADDANLTFYSTEALVTLGRSESAAEGMQEFGKDALERASIIIHDEEEIARLTGKPVDIWKRREAHIVVDSNGHYTNYRSDSTATSPQLEQQPQHIYSLPESSGDDSQSDSTPQSTQTPPKGCHTESYFVWYRGSCPDGFDDAGNPKTKPCDTPLLRHRNVCD